MSDLSPATGRSTSPAVEIDGLVMRYGDKVAVDRLSLTVDRGTIAAVLGPNGAGKTTALETCEGYRRPTEGRVRVLGLDPRTQRRELMPRIGVMLQSGGAWGGVRAVEMLRHVASLHAHPLPVDEVVERLGLGDCGRTPYRRLSGGQQQRLSLATAIVGRPELVFVDEPTAGMDPQARHRTWELLEELRSSGVSVVLTTHYLEEAERLADVVHIMDHGRLIASGTPRELSAGLGDASLTLVLAAGAGSVEEHQQLARAIGDDIRIDRAEDGSVELSGPAGPGALSAIASWCEARDQTPRSLRFGERTLEDVFLNLTGRDLR